ncbi:very large A-kinase anchor protein-like [Heptranchias perlo]|uniref:very large A-kinase anchor protein-like n=1 Tax=Heptranchias perlo TaxID=212740 RepID=UPI00355A17FE
MFNNRPGGDVAVVVPTLLLADGVPQSPKGEQTTESPEDGKTDEQPFSGSSNKFFADLAKVFQDQEKSSAQEKPTASETIALFPGTTFGIVNQPEDGIRQKLGSFFSRTPKSKPDQPQIPSQIGSVSSPDLNTENQYGTRVPNWNDDPEKGPFSKHITKVLDSDAGENGRETLETRCPETSAIELTFVQTQLVEPDRSKIAPSKAIGPNSSTSAQHKERGRPEEKVNGSASTTDPITNQKLQEKFNGSFSLERDVGSVSTDKGAVDKKTLTKLQTVAGEHKENNGQVLEDGANQTDNSENEQDMSLQPTITYSTYCGARRIRRRRSRSKPFKPLNATISEVDEKSVISLVDQQIMNPLEEETSHDILLQAPTMTGIQTPLEEKITLINDGNLPNNGQGNNELQPRICTEKFPSNKPGWVKDAKTENETLTLQSSLSEVSREIELTGPRHDEITKVEHECSAMTTATIDSTKKQVLQTDTSVSNTTGIQKITAVNPDDMFVPTITLTLEDLHSKGRGVVDRAAQCLVLKDNLITKHDDQSHKDEVYVDTTTGKIIAQTDISPKTTIIDNSQQETHVPSALKTISKKEYETDVPKAHCSTVGAVEAATTQNLKPVNSNNFIPLTETDQQTGNTHGQRKGIVADSAEDRALTVPVIIGSKLDDMEKKTEKTEPVGKIVSLTEPEKTIHLSNELDTPKLIPNETCDKYDVQLEIAGRTQTNRHTTMSDTFEMSNNKAGIPDVSASDTPKKCKGKDNVTELSTWSLTTDNGSTIDKPSKEYSQTTQRKSVLDIIHVNEESSSEALQKQMSNNSSTLTTVEVINEARNEDIATNANFRDKSTIVIENNKHLKIPSDTVSTIATEAAPSAMQSDGVSNSEATTTTELREIAEASYVQKEKALYIQKPDQSLKISSEKDHDRTSKSLQYAEASLLEPKISRGDRLSLANESVFYRYYQESTDLLLGSNENACTIANSDIITVPVFKQNQLVEEVQDNRKASHFVTAQKDISEKSMGTSNKYSPSENNLWYRCFQQSTGFSHMGKNTQSNIVDETHSRNTQTDEIVRSIKPNASVANSAKETIQGILQEGTLNNSRMTQSNEQNEEMAKRIKTSDSKDSNASHSVKPEGNETALKIKEKEKEQITLQSGAELIRGMCEVDASQVHPVETVLTTDSDDALTGKTKEVAEEMIFSVTQVTPHSQLRTTVIKENVTTVETGSDVITITRVKGGTEDTDLNENTNNLTVKNMIEETLEELMKTVQVSGERVKEVVQSEIPEESGNNSISIDGGEIKASPLVTHESVSEYVPSVYSADEKEISMTMKPHEKSIKSVPLLPVDTDLTLAHPVQDVINQEANTGFLNLISTSHTTGNTESLLKTDKDKVNAGQVRTQDSEKEPDLRTELRNTVAAADDSLPEAPSEMPETDNQNSDSLAQEITGIETEQCNIIDPAQSPAVLRNDSVKLTQLNDFQENSIADFEKSVANSEEENNFQSSSDQLKISKSNQAADQAEPTNQNTKSEEDGTYMVSKIQISSSIPVSDLVKPVNEMAKRIIQKIVLSAQETVTTIQVPGATQLPLSDSGLATESDTTLPSEAKSVVELVSFTEPVTPHTQLNTTVIKEDDTTVEIGSDVIKDARVKGGTEDIDLNESTNNLTVKNMIEETPEELVKTVQVSGERVKEVVQSEIPEESGNNSISIAGGESKASPLVTHENVSEYVPSVYSVDEKEISMTMNLYEKSIKSVPLLPVDTDLSLAHPVQDVINQEANTSLLNLISTSHTTGITESLLKTGKDKVNAGQVRTQDSEKEPDLRTELRNTVAAADDSLPEAPSEMPETDNQNSDSSAQEFTGIETEQCTIIGPAQSPAVLRNDSVKSIQSNDFQENSIADLEKSVANSEEENNFQSSSDQLKISKSNQTADQAEPTNQNTKSEEDGTYMVSKIQISSSIPVSDLVKPVNEMAKRIIQKIVLSAQETVTTIQVPGATQLPLSDSGPATESDTTLPSEAKSVVELVSFTEPVTPHTQLNTTVIKEDDTTVEIGSDVIKDARVKGGTEDIDLNESTNNLTVKNMIEETPEELVKTVQVSGERVKEVVQSEIPEESGNNSISIAGGESKASPLVTHENVSEYVPSVYSADEKEVSMTMKPHEKSIKSVPLLPVDTDLTLVHPVQDVINQEANTSLLNLISTSHTTGITESLLKTGKDKVNAGQVRTQDSEKEPVLRTELRNTVAAADDSLPEAPSEMPETDNQNSDSSAQEFTGIETEQCNIIDPAQSPAVLRNDSVKLTQLNDFQENVIADFEESKSSQLADQSDFTNESTKNAEEEEAERNPQIQTTFTLLFARLTNLVNVVTENRETMEDLLKNENEMEPQFSEQEALILDTSLSHDFKRRKIYPFALPPIYEEQDLENEATMDTYNINHSPTSTTQYNSNKLVTSVLESAAKSLDLMQTKNIVQEIEEEEENPKSPVPVLEVSMSLSSNHLDKTTVISQDITEEQNLSSQLQTETCVVDSKTPPKPVPSATVGSVFYRYFQMSKDYLPEDEQASSERASKMLTHLQQKPIEESNLLKCAPESKCLVKNKNLKINPRPGKMVIYDQLNFHGRKREILTDVSDATSWIFSEGVSLKVVRGCWILYEKPEFQGQMYILEEGQRKLDKLWVNNSFHMESTPTKIVIGSIKRVIKNHCIPEIAISQEPQQDDIKTYLHSEVACIEECGITPTISSIIVNSGIWLVYNKPNFHGHFTLLETGSSPVQISTEAKSNNVKSLRPLKMGGLKVERPMSPKVVIFEKTFFNGHFKEICKDTSDLKNLWENVTDIDDFRGAGSIRVIGGVWVCYEKECYKGYQYLLEEGEYEDWQAWGGFNSTVQSLRYIQADYMKPEITLFEETDLKKGNNIFVNRAIPNLENIEYGTVTQSIEVKNGVWVAYHEEHYSGEQYILEKGVYRNYTGWGGTDSSIMSIRPIQLEPSGGDEVQFQLQAYNGIDFQGESVEFVTGMASLPSLPRNSFKVLRGCWVLYDEENYGGCQYVLEEGHYPDLDSLGCLSAKRIRSLKPISNDFSMPSISLFSLYSFEHQELILTEGVSCLKDKGYYQYPKSVKVNSGIWIAYEHANFRGKQLLLECIEITNWNKFSGWKTIGSIHPLKQPTVYFTIKNRATGTFVTVGGDSENPRRSKLSVCPYNGKPTQIWFYCNGLIKSKANFACIDVIGGHGKAGTKVNLWTEHGRIHQKWNINRNGTISPCLDFNLRLDIKGGDFYDKDHILLNMPEQQQQTQFWDIEVLR